jgi:hypothetical protein
MSHPNVESLLQPVESPVELARNPQIEVELVAAVEQVVGSALVTA